MSDYDGNVPNSDQPENEAEGKKKLTDMQLRILQAIAGIISAAALLVSLFYMPKLAETNSLLQYLFLVIFLIIMFGRRSIENKYRLRLNLFGLVLIDGIMAGILLYLGIVVFSSPENTIPPVWQAVILVAGCVLLLGGGVAWPLIRYFKRKANGTLPPIRLPEKKDDPEAQQALENRPMTIEEKIAEMTRELDEQAPQSEKEKESQGEDEK
jgi:hypothetical protein